MLCLLLAACLPEPAEPTAIPPTETATVTPTTTATIVWFPPTATYTPMPTLIIQPTEDLRPPVGKLTLQDPFTDKTLWQTTRTAVGNIAYGKGELTLAVSASRGTLTSLRKGPQLDNFYLEIDAQPSLCRGEDAYGVLLRASSSQDYYRLSINCNGLVRMDRLKNARQAPLQDWVVSGQVLPGGLMRTRIGVWASGQELRIYINDEFHFTVKDPVFTSGTVGVFARSAGETPLTVNFSNLSIYQIGASSLRTPPKAATAPAAKAAPVATAAPAAKAPPVATATHVAATAVRKPVTPTRP